MSAGASTRSRSNASIASCGRVQLLGVDRGELAQQLRTLGLGRRGAEPRIGALLERRRELDPAALVAVQLLEPRARDRHRSAACRGCGAAAPRPRAASSARRGSSRPPSGDPRRRRRCRPPRPCPRRGRRGGPTPCAPARARCRRARTSASPLGVRRACANARASASNARAMSLPPVSQTSAARYSQRSRVAASGAGRLSYATASSSHGDSNARFGSVGSGGAAHRRLGLARRGRRAGRLRAPAAGRALDRAAGAAAASAAPSRPAAGAAAPSCRAGRCGDERHRRVLALRTGSRRRFAGDRVGLRAISAASSISVEIERLRRVADAQVRLEVARSASASGSVCARAACAAPSSGWPGAARPDDARPPRRSRSRPGSAPAAARRAASCRSRGTCRSRARAATGATWCRRPRARAAARSRCVRNARGASLSCSSITCALRRSSSTRSRGGRGALDQRAVDRDDVVPRARLGRERDQRRRGCPRDRAPTRTRRARRRPRAFASFDPLVEDPRAAQVQLDALRRRARRRARRRRRRAACFHAGR